jgi:ubiquitin-like protein Pup
MLSSSTLRIRCWPGWSGQLPILQASRAAPHLPVDAHVDGILDEIDEVLEENAEEFVRSYVQKGGTSS